MSQDNRPVPPLEYLLDASRTSLKSFHLAQLARAADSRKAIRSILDEWVESAAMALLAEWMELYGEELVLKAAEVIAQEKTEDEKTGDTLCVSGSTDAPRRHHVADPLPSPHAQRQAFFRSPHRIFRKTQASG